MRAEILRKVGQAVTALSAVMIAYATLRPNISTDIADDSVLHFLLFLPLGAGGALWMSQLPPALQKRARLGILLLVLFFAAATELMQVPMEGRTGSISDFFADAAGGGVGLLVGGWLAARAKRNGH
jgi:VanZ family protein